MVQLAFKENIKKLNKLLSVNLLAIYEYKIFNRPIHSDYENSLNSIPVRGKSRLRDNITQT